MLSETRTNLPLLAAKLITMAFLFVIGLALFSNFNVVRSMDFISFWTAGQLTIGGDPASAFDVAIHEEAQSAVIETEGLLPFAYPPPFLFVVTPFALLPYAAAALSWVALTYAFYNAVAQRLAPNAGWTASAFPPVPVNGIIGQNGLLTAGLFIWGMTLLKRHPIRSGLVLGCLVIKPHLGVLLPLALAAGNHWRAFVGAALSSVGLLVFALLIFGVGTYQAFFEQLPLFSSIANEGLVGWHKMASVYAALSLAGVGSTIAWAMHILVALAGTIIVGLVWRSQVEIEAKAAILACASVLISPYLYQYDTLLLALPFIWLAHSGEDLRVLAALWCIPFIVALQNWGWNELINPAPILPIAMMVLIMRRIWNKTPAQG